MANCTPQKKKNFSYLYQVSICLILYFASYGPVIFALIKYPTEHVHVEHLLGSIFGIILFVAVIAIESLKSSYVQKKLKILETFKKYKPIDFRFNIIDFSYERISLITALFIFIVMFSVMFEQFLHIIKELIINEIHEDPRLYFFCTSFSSAIYLFMIAILMLSKTFVNSISVSKYSYPALHACRNGFDTTFSNLNRSILKISNKFADEVYQDIKPNKLQTLDMEIKKYEVKNRNMIYYADKDSTVKTDTDSTIYNFLEFQESNEHDKNQICINFYSEIKDKDAKNLYEIKKSVGNLMNHNCPLFFLTSEDVGYSKPPSIYALTIFICLLLFSDISKIFIFLIKIYFEIRILTSIKLLLFIIWAISLFLMSKPFLGYLKTAFLQGTNSKHTKNDIMYELTSLPINGMIEINKLHIWHLVADIYVVTFTPSFLSQFHYEVALPIFEAYFANKNYYYCINTKIINSQSETSNTSGDSKSCVY